MIRAHDVTKVYGDKPVLQNLSFQIRDGETFAITGPSGSGKTTLIRLMLALEAPDAGELIGINEKRTRAVFQEDRLIEHLSAHQNVALAVRGARDDAAIDILLCALKLPEGDKSPVRSYSGGMKRRVAIARALICSAELLLLDEPFTGLDEELKSEVIQTILRYKKNATLAVVTHNPDDAIALGASFSCQLTVNS